MHNVNLFVKHISLFHMSRTLVEDKHKIASFEKDLPNKGKYANNQNWKGKNKKYGQRYFWCCDNAFDGSSCGDTAAGQDWNYGIGTVGSYGTVGRKVCDWHQKILK